MPSPQEQWMQRRHPAVAKRWFADLGRGVERLADANPEGHGEESNDPKVDVLVKEKDGAKRDWAKPGLSGVSKMFRPRDRPTPNIMESEQEGPVSFHQSSFPGVLGVPERPSGFRGRDGRKAAVARITGRSRGPFGDKESTMKGAG